jgi:hypothetical protein
MGDLSYPHFRDTLNLLADGATRHDYRIAKVIDSDDSWLATWANDQLYVIVAASVAEDGPHQILIDIHAGGGYGAEPHGSLFQALATGTWRFDHGGPWARIGRDGTVAYGWRTRLPSEAFSEANKKEMFILVLNMIDAFGNVAGTLANEFIPIYGGKRSHDEDPESWPALLSGLLPPQGASPNPLEANEA